MEVKLGQKVRDKVSGFKGIAIGRSIFLNGCARVGVQPKTDKDGKHVDAVWFDEPQLEVLDKKPIMKPMQETGGPLSSTPTRQSNPRR